MEQKHYAIGLAIFLAIVLGIAGYGIADPQLNTHDSDTQISTNQSAGAILEDAYRNTKSDSYTAVERTYNENGTLTEKQVIKTGELDRSLKKVFLRLGDDKFSVAQAYRGEHILVARSDTNTKPQLTKTLEIHTAGFGGTPYAERERPHDGRPLLQGNPSELRKLNVNETHIVVGVTTTKNYNNYYGADYAEGKFRAIVNRNTGELESITNYRAERTSDGSLNAEREEWVFKNHGQTTVERPGWVPFSFKQYLYDAVTVPPYTGAK